MPFSYCNKCLTTSLRPNAQFENGICSACNFASSQTLGKNIKIKTNLINNIKAAISGQNRNRSGYDCIIGVSGGKDSLRQAIWVRDALQLRPLLVCCSYPPLQMIDLGAQNISNLIQHGFDLEMVSPAPDTARRLSLQTFQDYGNVCKASEMALVSSIPRSAIEHTIPIAFFGENPALQEGDYSTMGKDETDANKLGNLNTLGNGQIDWADPSLTKYKLSCYEYPQSFDFHESGLKMFYIGPVWEDWGISENALSSALNGLITRDNKETVTGDITNASMLDEEFTNINMMIKYYKFGFGRATDLCNELIRKGELDRSKAISIVERFDGLCSDEIIERYCEWIGISVTDFWVTVEKFVNRDLFSVGDGRPRRKFKVGNNELPFS